MTSSAYGLMDDLTYSYSGNQLTSVLDAATASGTVDFHDNGSTGANEFEYDANGNLTVDGNKSLSADYNHLNLPIKVAPIIIGVGSGDELLYLYDALGTKLARRVKQGGTPVSTRQFLGSFVYEGSQLEYFSTADGRVVPVSGGGDEFRYEYFYRDHLGNTRMRFSDLDGDGVAETTEILQEWSYYPYGLVFEGLGTPAVGTAHRDGFNGKELENEFGLGWNAPIIIGVGARRYDAALGRWCGVDALAEKYAHVGPFVAFDNNPILKSDPTGGEWIISWQMNENGTATVNIVVNAAIINRSGKEINMDNLSNNIKDQFSNLYGITGNFEGVEVQVNAKINIRQVGSLADVRGKEHLIDIKGGDAFEDNDPSGKHITGGTARLGGLYISLNSKTISEEGEEYSNRNSSHELGHTGGLIHVFEFYSNEPSKFANGKPVDEEFQRFSNVANSFEVENNFMNYEQYVINSFLFTDIQEIRKKENIGKAHKNQIQQIFHNLYRGNLNYDDKPKK